ncbi:MAG: LolA family protein [Pyrinomonadaceae bacterium]
MKSFLRLSIAAVALTLFFNAFAVMQTKAQGGVLNEILKRMDEHNKSLTSLQASVKMDKYNAQLDEPDVTEGTVKYLPLKGRDALVRIDWTKPVEESLAVVDKQYILYRPRLKQAIVGKVDNVKSNGKGANNALAFINMSKEQLKANYNIKYLGQENVSGGTQTWHLELTPKTATSYKSAELWVDGNGMPIQAKVIEINKDSTTIFLSNLEKNKTINASLFKIILPKGTSIVKG